MVEMKIVYIAHQIGGDPFGNVNRILRIIRHINLNEPDVVPFAPYIGDVLIMSDTTPEERERGIRNTISLFNKDLMDEIRLYGDRISKGMAEEIKLAEKRGIPVKDYLTK